MMASSAEFQIRAWKITRGSCRGRSKELMKISCWKSQSLGSECRWVVECLPNAQGALGLIPSTGGKIGKSSMFDICLQVKISPDENSLTPVQKDLCPLSCVLPASAFLMPLTASRSSMVNRERTGEQSRVPGKCFAECEAWAGERESLIGKRGVVLRLNWV